MVHPEGSTDYEINCLKKKKTPLPFCCCCCCLNPHTRLQLVTCKNQSSYLTATHSAPGPVNIRLHSWVDKLDTKLIFLFANHVWKVRYDLDFHLIYTSYFSAQSTVEVWEYHHRTSGFKKKNKKKKKQNKTNPSTEAEIRRICFLFPFCIKPEDINASVSVSILFSGER